MNRHHRRALSGRTGTTLEPPAEPPVPPLVLRVAKIDPIARSITEERVAMSPQAWQAFMGKHRWHQAIIGHENGADVMVMGDKFPQVAILSEPEPQWMLRGGNFGPGAVCHGVGAVIGLLVEIKKATSLPMGIDWVEARIEWEWSEDWEA